MKIFDSLDPGMSSVLEMEPVAMMMESYSCLAPSTSVTEFESKSKVLASELSRNSTLSFE